MIVSFIFRVIGIRVEPIYGLSFVKNRNVDPLQIVYFYRQHLSRSLGDT